MDAAHEKTGKRDNNKNKRAERENKEWKKGRKNERTNIKTEVAAAEEEGENREDCLGVAVARTQPVGTHTQFQTEERERERRTVRQEREWEG